MCALSQLALTIDSANRQGRREREEGDREGQRDTEQFPLPEAITLQFKRVNKKLQSC